MTLSSIISNIIETIIPTVGVVQDETELYQDGLMVRSCGAGPVEDEMIEEEDDDEESEEDAYYSAVQSSVGSHRVCDRRRSGRWMVWDVTVSSMTFRKHFSRAKSAGYKVFYRDDKFGVLAFDEQ